MKPCIAVSTFHTYNFTAKKLSMFKVKDASFPTINRVLSVQCSFKSIYKIFFRCKKCRLIFIPRRKSAFQLLRGPIFFNLGFIGVVKGVWGSKNTNVNRPFWKLENALSPGGSLLCRLLRGPIVFNLGFIGVGNVYGTFFSLWGNGRF